MRSCQTTELLHSDFCRSLRDILWDALPGANPPGRDRLCEPAAYPVHTAGPAEYSRNTRSSDDPPPTTCACVSDGVVVEADAHRSPSRRMLTQMLPTQVSVHGSAQRSGSATSRGWTEALPPSTSTSADRARTALADLERAQQGVYVAAAQPLAPHQANQSSPCCRRRAATRCDRRHRRFPTCATKATHRALQRESDFCTRRTAQDMI